MTMLQSPAPKVFAIIGTNGGKIKYVAHSWDIISTLVRFRRLLVQKAACGLTASSSTVTLTDTSSLTLGMEVTADVAAASGAFGLPVRPTITAIVTNTSFTMSAPATVTGSRTLVFSDPVVDAQSYFLAAEIAHIVPLDQGTFIGDLAS